MANVLGSLAHSQVTRQESSRTHGCSLSICPQDAPSAWAISQGAWHPRTLWIQGTLCFTNYFELSFELELVSSKDIVFKCSMFSLNLREILDEMKTNHFSMFQWLTCPTKWQTGVKCGRTLWEWPESNGSTFVPWEKSWWQNVDCVHVCYVHICDVHTCMFGDRVGWGAGVGSCNHLRHDELSQSNVGGGTRWRNEAEKLAYHKDYVFYVFPSVYFCNRLRLSHCTN